MTQDRYTKEHRELLRVQQQTSGNVTSEETDLRGERYKGIDEEMT